MNPANHLHETPARKSNLRASATELREFLQRIKGKGPREALGAVAQSRLGSALIQATLGTLVLMAALTVIPYALSDGTAAKDKSAAKKDKDDADKGDPKKDESGKPGDKAAVDPKKDKDAPPVKDADKHVKKDKPANPLDAKDDLLKDLDKK